MLLNIEGSPILPEGAAVPAPLLMLRGVQIWQGKSAEMHQWLQ